MGLDRVNLFEGQGPVFLAARNASGVPGPRWYLGETPNLTIEQSEEVETVKESDSGYKGTIARIGKGLTLLLKMTIRDIKQKNRLLANRGTALSISSGSVTAEAMPTMAVGDYYVTKNPGVSSLVITDSAGSPATLTLNTHYEIIDADQGVIKILALTGTQPYLCAYTKAATTGHTAHTDTSGAEFYLVFAGKNIAKKPFKDTRLEVYRLSFSPGSLLALKSDEVQSPELEAEILKDDTRESDSAFGPYFREINIDALDS